MQRASVGAMACVIALTGAARAQNAPQRRFPASSHVLPTAALSEDARDLRARFGVARASRLAQSSDADERVRGLERAGAIGTPEAIALLARARDASMRSDGRAEIAIARGLAMHVEVPAARAALVAIVEPPAAARVNAEDEARDPERAAQMDVARRIAALALAQSGDTTKIEKLGMIARGTGIGALAAEDALVAFPASTAMPWGRLTPRTMRLLARTSDRRASGVLLDAAKSGDPESRAAAIESLAALGDARVLDVARGVKSDDDARLRMAAATAFVDLGAPEAPGAVEQLLADDMTAGRGIALAGETHGPGLVRALAAQASVTTDLAVRAAAIAALGRDPGGEGIEALVALARDPSVRAGAMDAIARSPSAVAMGTIEKLAIDSASRRTAVRAYVVRALTRGEKSAAVDGVIAALARSRDARDRAVGVFARVALGEDGAAAWIEDGDPQVRRAAAMAAPATRATWTSEAREALSSRRAREEDPATRAVLAAALDDGDPRGHTLFPTHALLACARAGGADANLCALAFARRADDSDEAQLELLLASRDPILRAHVARGLALGDDPTRAGRLAAAYSYEVTPLVRRAIVAGFATCPRTAPSVADALAFAARFDPDAGVRWTASRVLANAPLDDTADATDIAWIHLIDANGAPPPAGATGALLRADGLAVPIVFDADGDALVPGTPAGSARLVLAPTLAASYAKLP
jgi:HEAT repeat protein